MSLRGLRGGISARLSALRYRPWQALALACISAVVVATAILAPMYDRGLQQALVSRLTSEAPPEIASVTVRSGGRFDPHGVSEPYTTDRLLEKFPASAGRYFLDPVSTLATSIAVSVPASADAVGALMHRDGMCSHVEFQRGTCPAALDEVAISTADAEVFGWSVGDEIDVRESSPLLSDDTAHARVLEVVGVYDTDPGQAYWVARPPTGKAGLLDADGNTQHDGWLATEETLASASQAPTDGRSWSAWAVPERTVDLLLDKDAVGVDELFDIGGPLTTYVSKPVDGLERSGPTADAQSGIPGIAASAERGRDHAHVLVPLFVIQLALLAALTLWLVLSAAIDQRRPEVAVVRLRGGDASGCRRLLTGELGPPIVVGWLLGVALAPLAFVVVGRRWLAPQLELEVSPLVLGSAVGVLVVELLMLWAATWPTARAPATDLLRQLPARAGWAVSLGPALLVVTSGGAFAATATGDLTGWVAVAAPTLVAVAAGLVLAHALGPVAAGTGRRLLASGRLVAGLGMVQLGRRRGMRTATATIVVASALLAFTVNALAVGERNRNELADATVGAPSVLNVGGTDLAAARAALRDLDPSGKSATLVVMAGSAGGGMSTIGVVPEEFARIAAFPDTGSARSFADALDQSAPEPLVISSARLALDARWSGAQPAGLGFPVDLGVVVVRPSEEAEVVQLEPGRPGRHGSGAVRWTTAALPCVQGCLLTGIVASNLVDGDVRGTVTVDAIAVAGTPLALGGADAWRDATPHANGTARPRASGSGVAFSVAVPRGFDARLGHASVPARLPAVTSGELPPDSQGRQFTSVGLDGVLRDMRQVATQPYVPGAPRDAAVVDLGVLERDGAELDPNTRLFVFLGPSVDPDRTADELTDRGVPVDAVTRIDDARRDFERSAPAWGLQLGVVAAVGTALLAGLVLAVALVTSWRLRAADAFAQRLNGVSGRAVTAITVLETMPVVLVAVVAGTVCGLVGSAVALPDVPFFDTPPALPVGDLRASWSSVLPVAATLLAALVLLVAVASVRVGRTSLARNAREG